MSINTLVNKVSVAATKIQLWWTKVKSEGKGIGETLDKGKSMVGDEQVLITILFIISLLLS